MNAWLHECMELNYKAPVYKKGRDRLTNHKQSTIANYKQKRCPAGIIAYASGDGYKHTPPLRAPLSRGETMNFSAIMPMRGNIFFTIKSEAKSAIFPSRELWVPRRGWLRSSRGVSALTAEGVKKPHEVRHFLNLNLNLNLNIR